MRHYCVRPDKMVREVELKLEVEPAHVGLLHAHPLLRGEAETERQVSIYYDTPKGKLHRHGWTLRVRRGERGYVQTVKYAGDGAGLFARGEWECRVPGPRPDAGAIAETPLAELLNVGQFAHLAPVFRTEVLRSTWTLLRDGAAIELTWDEGQVRGSHRSCPIQELELECKNGDAGALLNPAREIAERVPVKLGVLSTAERGFALAGDQYDAPVKATPVELDDDAIVAEGFAAIVAACLKHFRLNEPLLIKERNAEALHQARVALRRLRSALWLFKPAIQDSGFAAINCRLRQFTAELGEARNIDVLLATLAPGDAGRRQLEHERGHHYGRVIATLETPEFRSFMVELVAWSQAGEWRHGKRAGRRLTPYALKRLDKLWRSIEERGADLADLSVAERHQLRIDTKKIRYALEFLRQPLRAAGSDQKKFANAAEGIQESLGQLNDLAMARELAGEPDWLLRGSAATEDETAAHLLSLATRYLRKLRKVGAYWREAVD